MLSLQNHNIFIQAHFPTCYQWPFYTIHFYHSYTNCLGTHNGWKGKLVLSKTYKLCIIKDNGMTILILIGYGCHGMRKEKEKILSYHRYIDISVENQTCLTNFFVRTAPITQNDWWLIKYLNWIHEFDNNRICNSL